MSVKGVDSRKMSTLFHKYCRRRKTIWPRRIFFEVQCSCDPTFIQTFHLASVPVGSIGASGWCTLPHRGNVLGAPIIAPGSDPSAALCPCCPPVTACQPRMNKHLLFKLNTSFRGVGIGGGSRQNKRPSCSTQFTASDCGIDCPSSVAND